MSPLQALPGLAHILATDSGKGGVGKATVTVNRFEPSASPRGPATTTDGGQ